MADRFYPSTAHLLAALRLANDPQLWRQPVQRCRLRGPDGETGWLLRNLAGLPAGATAVPPGWTTAQVWEAPSLAQAVPLEPSGATAAIGWLQVPTPEAFVAAAHECLLLGNDRVRCAALADGQVLLRIEDLSAFLREKWLREPGHAIFVAAGDERFVAPLGWRYPLEDKLAFVGGDDASLWIIGHDQSWRQVRGEWVDLFERVAVDPERLTVEPLAAGAALPQVPVSLRLEPAETAERAQLWWLDAVDRPLLERLLQEATEAELNALQIGAVAVGDDPPSFVVVARLAGAGLAPPLYGGQAFCARLPVEQLYLPVGLRLVPVLSRRTLAEALDLGEDHLTLLTPTATGTRVTRLPRAALQPALDIVDYFAAEAAPEVADLLARVKVDYDLDLAAEDGLNEDGQTTARTGWWARLRRRLRR